MSKKILLYDGQRGFDHFKKWYIRKMQDANPILEEFEKEFEGVIKMDNNLTRAFLTNPDRFIDGTLTKAINEYAEKQKFIENVVRKTLLEKSYKFLHEKCKQFSFQMPNSAEYYMAKQSDFRWFDIAEFEIKDNRITFTNEYEAEVRDSFNTYVEGEAAADFVRIQSFVKELNRFADNLHNPPRDTYGRGHVCPIGKYYYFDGKEKKYKLNKITHI